MSRAKPTYSGTVDEFPLDKLNHEQRSEMVEQLKEFYPSQLPDTWNEFTELELSGLAGFPTPDNIDDPKEQFCFYVYYSAAQIVAEHRGDELSVVTLAQARAEVVDLRNVMKKVDRILPKRPTTGLPRIDIEILAEKCRSASDTTVRAIYSNDELVLSDERVDADLKYVSDTADEVLIKPSIARLNDMRVLLTYFIPQLELAVESGKTEQLTAQPDEVRRRRAHARLEIAIAVSSVLKIYGLSVSTYHSQHGAEHETHKWSGSSDLVQILFLLGKCFDIGGTAQTWSEVVRKFR